MTEPTPPTESTSEATQQPAPASKAPSAAKPAKDVKPAAAVKPPAAQLPTPAAMPADATPAAATQVPPQVPVPLPRPDADFSLDPAQSSGAKAASVPAGMVAAIAGLSLALGAFGGIGATILLDNANPNGNLPPIETTALQERPAGSIAEVARNVMPGVVSIRSFTDDVFTGSGSGFVISEDGYILTNQHVISGNDEFLVQYSDGEVESAELVGATEDYDLAVLKVKREGLVPLVLGDSDAMVVGDQVIAVGSPLGLDATVTTGIVSALHRPVARSGESGVDVFIDAIQTDAAINPGNSGGPLINLQGEVIGINSAAAVIPTATGSEGSVGLGFAIPSNQARRTAQQLIDNGVAIFPVIGVVIDGRHVGQGVLIQKDDLGEGEHGVVPGSPADNAGLKDGDIILAIDGRIVTRSEELVVAIRAKAVGDTITLTVDNGSEEVDIEVTLTASTAVDFGLEE